MSDELEETAHNAVTALGKGDLDPAVVVRGLEDLAVTCGLAVGKTYPFFKEFEGLLSGDTFDASVIDPLDAVARVEEMVGEVAVVGEDDEARGVPVKAAHRKIGAVMFGEIIGN